MAFIQIIEFRTDRIDEFDALLDQWLAQSKDWRTATRSTRTKDRDQSDSYVQIVEFPSYEKAQENFEPPRNGRVRRRPGPAVLGPSHLPQPRRTAGGGDVAWHRRRRPPVWHPDPVPINVLFAGVATADLDAATAWYGAVLGRPPDIVVHDDEVMWQIGDGGWLYLVRDPVRAGHGLVTMAVTDLDDAVAEIAGRGPDTPSIETIGSAGRKASYVDPDGNTIALIEVTASE